MHTISCRSSARRLTHFALASSAALALLTDEVTAAGQAPDAQPAGRTPNMAPVAEVRDGLVLWYQLDETSGTVAADSSGNRNDGTVHGAAIWNGAEGLAFNGSDTYVTIPDNIMAGLDSISVSFEVNISANQSTPYFIYGFGNTDSDTGDGDGDGYLFATGDSFRTAISLSNWSGEQNVGPDTGYNLARGTWMHVTYTQTGSAGVLYEDGVEVATNTSISVLPSDVGGGTTSANYIGRSLYAGDAYFLGSIRDFRVYGRALTADEAKQLAAPYNAETVAKDKTVLDLGDTCMMTEDLVLARTGSAGSTITWTSSDTSVVSDTGAVTRPAHGQADATVTLTARLAKGEISDTRDFTITVLAMPDDEGIVAEVATTLVVQNIDDVRGNLMLPTSGDFGTRIRWSSNQPSIISETGEVYRPAHGDGAATVTLTATVSLNEATATKDLTATVPESPVTQPREGYLFSYFTGESYSDGEQIYFALSNGNDPLSWREINDASPVLTSTLGTQGLRDPFIIRSPEGDKFYQIATDLKIYGNGDWDAAQRHGSKAIMVWESTDLVHWTDQRLVKVSPDTAGNTWAPEAFYDSSIGAYVVFWASKLYDSSDTNHSGSTYHRMMYATTRDFYVFSEPKVWKDPGYSVIDSTMIEHDGTYYRLSKDERNSSSDSPCSKFIIEEKSTQIRSTEYEFVAECIGSSDLSRGEGPLVFRSNTEDKWYAFIDEYGDRGYVPFSSTDLDSGEWTMEQEYTLPFRPRHGTVLPVTAAEYDRLLSTFQPDNEGLSRARGQKYQ